jgi:hypothetical protein
MRRSLIARSTAIGMLFAAAGLPVTGAAAADQPSVPALRCDGTAASEMVAAELAVACDEDVEVLGASTNDGVTLFAEPDGEMRLEATVEEDPVVWRDAASRTVLNPDAPSDYGWEGDRWVGYCDPVEYADGCAAAGVQRAVWQFDGFGLLADLEPEDITGATFIVNGETAWLDDVGCTANRLEIYDVPLISAATDWASTSAWTADRRVGGMSTYWPACEENPGYTGYFSFSAKQLAVDAARDDRTSVAVGVRAADESCMTCGWNLLRQHAILRINFNRAPLPPSALSIGFLYSKVPCIGEPALRTTMPFIRATIPDPDPIGGSNWVETATYRVADAAAPGTVLWEGTSTTYQSGHQAEVPPGVLVDGGRYVLTVFGTDNHGLSGPGTTCTFTIDTTPPEAPSVTPLVGGAAVYPTGVIRGGGGILGAFLLTSGSDDIVSYEYWVENGMTGSVAAGKNTVLQVAPLRSGENILSVRAVDKAGNYSSTVTYLLDASDSDFIVETPPAITMTGPTTYTLGDVPSVSVRLSEDAVTPYGTVTVKWGSTVVGNAPFDERTEHLTLDAAALGSGTKELTFTYRAYPEAPAWSTSRTIRIEPPAFLVSRSPSISGTAQVGKILTANRWIWTPTPTTVRYQWRADGRPVSGATSPTWKIPASAQGKPISVAVTGSRNGYTTKTVVSPATTAVRAGVFVAPQPTIAGTQRVGYTLKAVRGTWTPQPSAVKYQWKVGGVAVRGATGSAFTLPASARGKRVTVVITGSRLGYTTKTVTAAPTGVIR